MTLVSERVGQYFCDDHRLEYIEYGGGDNWVILLHGPLLNRRMHARLARQIAASGARVVVPDLLGHGRSDRPVDPTAHSTESYAVQVVALLDHLGVASAVIGGTSLGANVALEVAVAEPDRVLGLLVDRPALDNAVGAGVVTFTPLFLAARWAPWSVTGARLVTRVIPRRLLPAPVGLVADAFDQRPRALAATLHGLFFGRVAPSSATRRALDLPTLVLGRRRDPLHPWADAQLLAEEIPGAVLVEGAAEVAVVDFVRTCHSEPARGRLVGS